MMFSREQLLKASLLCDADSYSTLSVYNKEGRGTLVPSRIINHYATWWRAGIHKKENDAQNLKKKLILTDWSCCFDYKKLCLIEDLLTEGFEIYVWTGVLNKVTTLEELRELSRKIAPIRSTEVLKACAEQQLLNHQCMVVDYFQLNRLAKDLGNSVTTQSLLDNLSYFDDQNNLKAIFNSMEEMESIPLYINQSLFTQKHQNILRQLLAHFKESDFLLEIEIEYLTKEILDIFLEYKPKLKNLTILSNEYSISSDAINHLKKVCYTEKNPVKKFHRKEAALTNAVLMPPVKDLFSLQEYILQNSDEAGLGIILTFTYYTNLKTLEISLKETDSTPIFNPNHIQGIANFIPTLEKLTLSGHFQLDALWQLQLNEKSFSRLTTLELKNSNVNTQILANILRNTPNLETLIIEATPVDDEIGEETQKEKEGSLKEDWLLHEISLNKLKIISIAEVNISATFLKKLLDAAPNVEQIELPGCKFVKNIDDIVGFKLEENSLKNLTRLNLKDTLIFPSLISQFLSSSASSLQYLNINGFEPFEFEYELHNLEEEIIWPNLKKLNYFKLNDIRYDESTKEVWPISKMNCLHLQELCSGHLDDEDVINQILIQNPSLRQLNISCRSICFNQINQTHSLTLLKWEVEGRFNISTLYKLSKLFPQLTILQINGEGKLLEEKETVENISFPFLTTITLSLKKMPPHIVNKLIKNCPNLIRLNISADEFNLSYIKEIDFSNIKYLRLLNNKITKYILQFLEEKYPLLTINCDKNVLSSPSNPQSNLTRVDFNTKHEKKIFTPKEYFLPKINYATGEKTIAPQDYRLEIYFDICLNESDHLLRKPFTPVLEHYPLEIYSVPLKQLYHVRFENTPDYFYGQITLDLGNTDWQPLPSLHTMDELSHLYCAVPLYIARCKESGIYYIKPKQPWPHKEKISFIIHSSGAKESIITQEKLSPKLTFHVERLPFLSQFLDLYNIHGDFYDNSILRLLPSSLHGIDLQDTLKKWWAELMVLSDIDKVKVLSAYCQEFGEDELKTELKLEVNSSGPSNLRAMMHQMMGACGHRSDVFFVLATKLGLKVRIIRNQVHGFIEVLLNDKWEKIDLGGYSAQMNPIPIEEEKKALMPSLHPASQEPDLPYSPYASQPPNDDFSYYSDFVKFLLEKAQTLAPGQRNLLIACQNTEQMNQLNIALMQQGLPHFYIDNLDNIARKSLVVDPAGNHVIIDSPFRQFLQDKNAGLLAINWKDYKLAHVGFNSLFDSKQRFEDILFQNKVVISFVEENQVSEMGDDFNSRFRGQLYQCPQLPPSFDLTTSIPKVATEKKLLPVNLFSGINWEQILLGHVKIKGHLYHFLEGELIKAIEEKDGDEKYDGIELQNAPWDSPDFQLLMNELMNKRIFFVNGQYYKLPDHFIFTQSSLPYAWDSHFTVNPYRPDSPWDVVLNSQTFDQFFQNYHCENQSIDSQSGWLTTYSNLVLNILVEDEFSLAEWEYLLTTAEKNHCQLNFVVPHEVNIPKEMLKDISLPTGDFVDVSSSNLQTIVTNDIDLAEAHLLRENSPHLILNVTQHMHFSDLIEEMKIPDDMSTFDSQLKIVMQLLKDKKTVLLKGEFNSELTKKLETLFASPPYLWVNGKKETDLGKLILISENKEIFPFAPSKSVLFSEEHYWQHLELIDKFDQTEIETLKSAYTQLKMITPVQFNYIQLKTMLRQRQQGITNPLKSYLYLQKNPGPLVEISKRFYGKIADESKVNLDITKKRLDKVKDYLNKDPVIFIAGETSVGKSTFVLKELKESLQIPKIFQGFKDFKEWLTTEQNGEKILFIDEANLTTEDKLSIFEGLYANPPYILFDGVLYSDLSSHKVILAGNLANYEGRHEQKLIKRYGNVIKFGELPPDFLMDNILMPLLQKLFPNFSLPIPQIAEELLNIYQYINEHSPTKLTPRNLKNMLFQFATLYENHFLSGYDELKRLKILATLAAYDEARPLLQGNFKQQFFTECVDDLTRKAMKGYKADLKLRMQLDSSEFLLTKSRRNVVRRLTDQLHQRQKSLISGDSELMGTQGILIRGESGIGKSELVLAYLQSRGYTKKEFISKKGNNKADNMEAHPHSYYHITPTDPEKMREVLRQAFHEGAIVVIDELNTLPLEEELNALLDGTTQAQNPGFFILATENPISYRNRISHSPAFENRFTKINLKDYSATELIEIAHRNKINPASAWVAYHMQARRKEKIKPTLRNLLNPIPELLDKVNDSYAYRLLNDAVRKNDQNLFATLIELEELPIIDGLTTPLHLAVEQGNITMMESLLAKKLDLLYSKDAIGRNALHYAVNGGNTEMVEILLKKGLRVKSDRHANTILHIAIANNNLMMIERICQIYLNMKVNNLLDIKNDTKKTVWELAKEKNDPEIMTILERYKVHAASIPEQEAHQLHSYKHPLESPKTSKRALKKARNDAVSFRLHSSPRHHDQQDDGDVSPPRPRT